MRLQEIYDVISEIAPTSLSDELCRLQDLSDNSGIIVDTNEDIKNIVFALDLSNESVKFAKKCNANLIVTHHPAIFSPIKSISGTLLEAVAGNIAVISMHLNFDVAERGIDYHLAMGLGGKNLEIIQKLSLGGYGRRFSLDRTLNEIFQQAKAEFRTDKILCYGDKNSTVRTAASFCGAGLDERACAIEADLYISSDVRHHIILNLLDRCKALLCISHYASENYGLMNMYSDLCKNVHLKNIKMYFFDDTRFL